MRIDKHHCTIAQSPRYREGFYANRQTSSPNDPQSPRYREGLLLGHGLSPLDASARGCPSRGGGNFSRTRPR